MKIRTDFVTNSSSASYGEVVIDNLVLLDILARYKEIGIFGEETVISIGSFDDIDNYEGPSEPDPNIKTITPALHTFSVQAYPPSSLDEVIEKIIEVLRNCYDNKEQNNVFYFDQLKEELIQREDEILKAFKTVKWYSREVLYSGRWGCWEFKYDQENGEYYHDEQTGDLSV